MLCELEALMQSGATDTSTIRAAILHDRISQPLEIVLPRSGIRIEKVQPRPGTSAANPGRGRGVVDRRIERAQFRVNLGANETGHVPLPDFRCVEIGTAGR